MYRTLPYLALFAATVLLQVFLFDNLSISVYCNPLIYVAFLVLLPMESKPVTVLLAGFVLGVVMDLAMGSAGINTIATLPVAFLRPTLIGLLYGRDDAREAGVPSPERLGKRAFAEYLWPWSCCTMHSSSCWRPFRGPMCCTRSCASS